MFSKAEKALETILGYSTETLSYKNGYLYLPANVLEMKRLETLQIKVP